MPLYVKKSEELTLAEEIGRSLIASRIVRSHFLRQIDRSKARVASRVPLSSPHFTGLEYHNTLSDDIRSQSMH